MISILGRSIIFCMTLILGACPGENTYSGLYETRFEVSSFEPEGKEEEWWVTFDSGEYDKKFKPHIIPRETRYHLIVKGKVSSRGGYGHLGQYPRKIHIEKIIEVEAFSCRLERLKEEIGWDDDFGWIEK